MRFLQIVLCFATLLFCACSPSSTPSSGAQEIKPGDQSIITPPQRAQEAPSGNIGERPL